MSYLESDTGILYPRSLNGHALSEATYRAQVDNLLLRETIAALQAQVDELGWLRLGEDGAQFGRETIGKIVANARAYYLKNPVVQRGVEIAALYVWGQDLSHTAADPNVELVIDRFWKANRATLTGQQASRMLEVELQCTGNVFLALFPDLITGSVAVRGVPVEEVQEIVTNPQDRTEVWFYRREWEERAIGRLQSEKKRAYHPDWQYRPATQPPSIEDAAGAVPIRWDAPLMHVKVGAFGHWKWGVPEIYAALDWAKAYKGMLENDATRSAALARFAWKMTTEGGQQGVQAAKTRLATTLGVGNGVETNPPPAAGSVYIRGSKGNDLDPIDISRSILPIDHSRPARLMASAALGISDHFFDSDVGNFATAKTLDRPTELRFSERRQLWRDVLTDLCQWVIDRDIEAVSGILPAGQLDEDARKVELSWPSLLEREMKDVITAIVDAATLAGRALAGTVPEDTVARLLMVALGVEDIDSEIEKLEIERAEREEKAAQIAQQTQQQPGDDEEDEEDDEREQFVNALRRLNEVISVSAR